ncbi:MAG: hypothetical protein RMK99_04120 [Anaerolineales bacterium]|nr:hypothetical protein [Anaerolineales bacterium]
MNNQVEANANVLLRQLIIEVARLPDEDLPLVVEFIGKLAQRSQAAPGTVSREAIRHIRAEARRRAALMGEVPRAELVQRFLQAADEIRSATAASSPVLLNEEEWRGD